MARRGSAQYGEAHGSPQTEQGRTSFSASANAQDRSSRARYRNDYREASRSRSPYRRHRSPSPYRHSRSYQRNGDTDTISYPRNGDTDTASYSRNGTTDSLAYSRSDANDSRSYRYDGGRSSRFHQRNGDNDSRFPSKRKAPWPHAHHSERRRNGGDDYNSRTHYRNSHRDSRRGSPPEDYPSGPSQLGFVRERSAAANGHSEAPMSLDDLEQPVAVPDFRAGLSLVLPTQPSGQDSRRRDSRRRDQNSTSSLQAGNATSELATAQAMNVSVSQDEDTTMTDDTTEYSLAVVEDKVPTEESREEKRRRWAAKRAAAEQQKQKESLLQQAILAHASEVTTPGVASPAPDTERLVSPSASSQTANRESRPASPDVLVTEEHGQSTGGDGESAYNISAANYDPTQDMLADRDRAAKEKKDAEALAHRETDSKAAPVKKEKKEFDMFSEGDDEDTGEIETPAIRTQGVKLDQKLMRNWHDKNGYYRIINGESLEDDRFVVQKTLGRGAFAVVVEALEKPVNRLVALKIATKSPPAREMARNEIRVLLKLNEADKNGEQHIIRQLESFDFKGSVWIVMEKMEMNLRDYIGKQPKDQGISLPCVRGYARQMFAALNFLQQCMIVHRDIKPDNVLLDSNTKTLKLADFGLAMNELDLKVTEPEPLIASRYYRAPEAMFGAIIGYPFDVWAVACTIYEIWTGNFLFTGEGNNQMIQSFMDCLGWPTEKTLRKYPEQFVLTHFEYGGQLRFKAVREGKDDAVEDGKPYRLLTRPRKIPRDLKTRVHHAAQNKKPEDIPTNSELNDLTDMLLGCLNMNVEKRATVGQAIQHRFFTSPAAPRAPGFLPNLLPASVQG
ncbi:kinase-like protein [Pyrenochaeta sp. DS3sAY3a]|nr:kinase-like protein [Pyrenochaeta sp. DS3sAY3a]